MDDSPKTQLSACPFCGADADIVVATTASGAVACVECSCCGARTRDVRMNIRVLPDADENPSLPQLYGLWNMRRAGRKRSTEDMRARREQRREQRRVERLATMPTLDRIMTLCGTSARAARVLGVSQQAICLWRRDGIPAKRIATALRVLGELEAAPVTPHRLSEQIVGIRPNGGDHG